MFLPEKFPQKGITACTEKGMRGRLHSLFLLRAPHAVASGSFSDDIPAHAFPCGLSSGGNVRLWLSCFKIGSTANFPYVFQEFHRSETKVSHRGNFIFPSGKLLFPQWETNHFCGLMFLVDHFTAYFQIRLTQLILIFITS